MDWFTDYEAFGVFVKLLVTGNISTMRWVYYLGSLLALFSPAPYDSSAYLEFIIALITLSFKASSSAKD